jgi:ribonuclease BN (tRNA processing enzyme)
MVLKCLGTGTCVPALERGSSAYLLRAEKTTILIDIGPSAVSRVLESGCTIDDVDVIVLTHFHVDHVVDLATFLFASNYGNQPRHKPLTLVGGVSFPTFYKRLLRVYPSIGPKTYAIKVETVSKGSLKLGDVSIETVRTKHNRESIGVRVTEKGRSATFSGDTDYSANLIALAKATNVLVIECSFPQRKVKGHLNLDFVGKITKRAFPERVILSHLYPEWNDYRGVIHAPYVLGIDGLEVEV